MLEILLLIALTRRIGRIVEAKQRRAGWYKALTVALWIGGELAGGIVGGVLVALFGINELYAYPLALVGAAAGAGLSFVVARSATLLAPPAEPPPPPVFTNQN